MLPGTDALMVHCCRAQMSFSCLYQVFVTEHVLQLAMLRHTLSVCQYDEALDCGQLGLHAGHQIYKGRIQHDVLVLCMIDDVI